MTILPLSENNIIFPTMSEAAVFLLNNCNGNDNDKTDVLWVYRFQIKCGMCDVMYVYVEMLWNNDHSATRS